MKNDVNKAVKLLGDMVSNSRFDANELELVREEVHQEHEENHTRY